MGTPDIDPYDMVYMLDTYEGIQGSVQAGDVVHTLSPDTGFTTTIIPRAEVTVLDPARFSLKTYQKSVMQLQAARNYIRHQYRISADTAQGFEELQKSLVNGL